MSRTRKARSLVLSLGETAVALAIIENSGSSLSVRETTTRVFIAWNAINLTPAAK
jgi:hypothetical protein